LKTATPNVIFIVDTATVCSAALAPPAGHPGDSTYGRPH
jgi:hypothetical protein